MSYEADGLKSEIDEVLYELSKAVLAQKQVEDILDRVSGSLLMMGLRDPRVNTPGVIAAKYAASEQTRSIMQSLFNMRQDLTLQRDKL